MKGVGADEGTGKICSNCGGNGISGIDRCVWVFLDSLTVTNHIALGDVNIGLKEYQKKGSTEVLYTNPKTVIPGETISKIPRITNLAKPCWVEQGSLIKMIEIM